VEELQLQVVIGEYDGDAPCIKFNTGDSVSELYQDLIEGKEMPLVFVTPNIEGVHTMVAIVLFLHRELALQPSMLTFVGSAALVQRIQLAGLAHIDRDLARFFQLLRVFLPDDPKLTKRQQGERLRTVVDWIRQYVLENRLPALLPESEPPKVLETGTVGFVVAETSSRDLMAGWVELYRLGYLRGLLMGPERDGRRAALVACKSRFVTWDLAKVGKILNEAERAMGDAEWKAPWPGWLEGPAKGTFIPQKSIVEVLIRV